LCPPFIMPSLCHAFHSCPAFFMPSIHHALH